MRKTILSMALLVLIGAPSAFAQGGIVGGLQRIRTSRPMAAKRRSATASRAPATCREKNLSDPNDPLSKENAALDRKIKSICRGC